MSLQLKPCEASAGFGTNNCVNRLNKPLDATKLQLALGEKLHFFASIDSTNQYLLQHAKQLTDGSVCLALLQSAGRGRRGKRWHSPQGANLYWSQLLHVKGDKQHLSGLSLVVGIRIAETLTALGLPDIKVKWPNDLYWQGKKFGGILLETVPIDADTLAVVIGVGINIDMQASDETAAFLQSWTTLSEIVTQSSRHKPNASINAQVDIDKTALVIALIAAIEQAATRCVEVGLSEFIPRWLRFDHYINQRVSLSAEAFSIEGVALGIDEQGALLLDVKGETQSFHSGELSLRPVTPLI